MKKRKFMFSKKRIAALFLLLTLCFTEISPVYAKETEKVIEITTMEDFLELTENCRLDVYSVGKVVELKTNLNFSGREFSGIPYFNGTFHGNGFTISGINIGEKGSQAGLFRYVGELGNVLELNVAGTVRPSGSQIEVGGIVGVNYGTIQECSFKGTVCGIEAVGAIAGINKSTGQILGCSSDAIVMATNDTGGIAGVNAGIIDDCTNNSKVNIEELETILDIGGIDFGTLNMTRNVVTRNNMGGIAGISSGVISNCNNNGEIGYAHTGYNVGGIAGSQKGVILNCSNDGKVFGRKDVGGIVGQAEPYIESEYLSDQIEQTKNDLDRMSRTLTGMIDSMEKTSDEVKMYSDELAQQYEAANESLEDRLEQMEEAIPEENQQAKGYFNNITEAQNRIQKILEDNEDNQFSEEEKSELLELQKIIEDNVKRLEQIAKEEASDQNQEISIDSWEYVEKVDGTEVSDLEESRIETITNGIDAITSGIDSITNEMDVLSEQADTTVEHLYDSSAVIRGERDVIADVSSIKNAATMDGVISGCINRGIVEGDLNVGGIAGTMNIEYDEDPEADFSITKDVAISSDVNDIIISSINYGKINGKKNYLGSIVGFQEFGLVYNCEGYGHVISDSGSYIGGIAGRSGGVIEKSYSMSSLSGTDYIGGIAGDGASIIGCLSIEKIDTEGEKIGGIAGALGKGGTVEANYFVKDGYDGIDDISYVGVAEPRTYEEIMLMKNVPNGFKRVSVTYEADGNVISERLVPYGSSLTAEDLPVLEDREDAYVKWPQKEIYKDIKSNLTIEAEYVPWDQSAASEELLDEKPLFLAGEHFYEGAKISLIPLEQEPYAEEKQHILYSYGWELVMDGEKEYDAVSGHFYIPEEYRESAIEVWTVNENQWAAVDVEWNGSYIVAEIPFEAPFAVVEIEKDNTKKYVMIGAAVLVLLLVISGVIVRRRRKQKKS